MMSSGEDDVHEAIRLIVKTAKRERKMRPGFGSNINRYAFNLKDRSSMVMIERDLRNAIMKWEPRVGDVEVKAYGDSGREEIIKVDISYKILEEDREYVETIELEAI